MAAKAGWRIEAGELVFYPMPGSPLFTEKECCRLSRGHLRLNQAAVAATLALPGTATHPQGETPIFSDLDAVLS